MIFFLKLYALTLPVFFIMDMLWLGIIARGSYRRNLASILSPDVNWPAAFIFYFIYVAGIIFFAVRPAVSEGSLGNAALLGALFGFFTYATYDLTNLATIKEWPVVIVVVDMIWGVCLCTLVAVSSFTIAGWLL